MQVNNAMTREANFKPYLSTFVGTPYYLGVPKGQVSCDDVVQLPKTATVIELEKPYRNLDQLYRFPNIKRISCSHFEDTWVKHLATLPNLRHLDLSFVKAESLPSFKSLKALRVLVLYRLTKLKTLDFLRGLSGLQSLGLSEIMWANDLAPLATLIDLRELDIDGAMLKAKFIESLEPIGKLKRLEYLSLACRVKPENRSLRSLGGLKELRKFIVSERFNDAEKDWLVQRLPKLPAINAGMHDQYPPPKKFVRSV